MHLYRRSWFVPGSILLAVALVSCSDTSSLPSDPQFDEVLADDAETLLGESVEELGTCAEGWRLVFKPGHATDLNQNDYVCYSDELNVHVDDKLPVEGPETEFAGGHGNYTDAGKKVTQDISFSFHGRQNKSMVVKGEFEFHDQLNNLRIHGNVTCLIVSKNIATLGGVIEQSTDPKLRVGTFVRWQTADNGEGINEPVDFMSRPEAAGKKEVGCGKFAIKHQLIQSGNIQVLN